MAEGVRKDEEFSGTREVEERHRSTRRTSPNGCLTMSRALPARSTVLQFKGGQSNPTYRLNTPGRSYVMRRRPVRQIAAVGACGRSRVPRHRPHSASSRLSGRARLCALHGRRRDRLGLLHHVDGGGPRVLGSRLPSQTPDRAEKSSPARSRRWQNSIPSIPRRSACPISASPAIILPARSTAGPSSTAPPRPQHIPEFEKLAEWLPKTVPPQERISVVHGDYRLDNMIFHPTEPRVLAVLDWELSTLGDPMADFTYLLMQWTMPGLANCRPQGAEHPEPG